MRYLRCRSKQSLQKCSLSLWQIEILQYEQHFCGFACDVISFFFFYYQWYIRSGCANMFPLINNSVNLCFHPLFLKPFTNLTGLMGINKSALAWKKYITQAFSFEPAEAHYLQVQLRLNPGQVLNSVIVCEVWLHVLKWRGPAEAELPSLWSSPQGRSDIWPTGCCIGWILCLLQKIEFMDKKQPHSSYTPTICFFLYTIIK